MGKVQTGAFGGLVAFGVQHAHVAIHPWRLLFIIEVKDIDEDRLNSLLIRCPQGTPTILMGLVALFFLPDRPEATSYLTEREREIAVDRMNRATSGDIGAKVNKGELMVRYG